MRDASRVVRFLLVTVLFLCPTGTLPADEASEDSKKVRLYLSHAVRWESWAFFDPGEDVGDPDYGFVGSRVRFGFELDRPKWRVHGAGQFVSLEGLPDDAPGLGTGAVYFAHAGEDSPSTLYLKYLTVEFRDIAESGASLSFGRMDYSGGLERMTGNRTIDWLKKVRLDARLLGGFGWSLFQRSFDGARLTWDHDAGQLSLAALRPTQGGFEEDANKTIDEIDVVAAAYSFVPDRVVPNAELQLFYYRYDDEREIPRRIDNAGAPAPIRQDVHLDTFGAHYAGAFEGRSGTADLLVWAVYQTGDWFEQSHDAQALAVEAGYQLRDVPWKPWVRAGVFRGSGDRSPGDGKHETFFQLLPTVRKYAFTASYNLMNNTDYFVQLVARPGEKWTVRSDVHFLSLTEGSDLWYSGAGATQSRGTITGYAGKPSGGLTSLGTSAELTVQYKVNKYFDLHVFYGHVFGGALTRSNFPEDEDLDFFFVESTLKF